MVSREIWEKHALMSFSKTQIELVLRTRAILYVFEKTHSCMFFPNCTRNHTITNTNWYESKTQINYLLIEIRIEWHQRSNKISTK